MSHDHEHGHEHGHDESGQPASPTHVEATDLSIPDAELSPKGLNRRNFLRGTGLLGAGAAAVFFLVVNQGRLHEPSAASHDRAQEPTNQTVRAV